MISVGDRNRRARSMHAKEDIVSLWLWLVTGIGVQKHARQRDKEVLDFLEKGLYNEAHRAMVFVKAGICCPV